VAAVAVDSRRPIMVPQMEAEAPSLIPLTGAEVAAEEELV